MHCTCVKGLLVSWDKVLLKVLICRTKMNVLVWRTETKRGRFHSYANTNANSNTEQKVNIRVFGRFPPKHLLARIKSALALHTAVYQVQIQIQI